MSSAPRGMTPQEWAELRSLVDRSLDGRQREADVQDLERLLLGCPAAQDYYLEACQLHHLINMENRAARVVESWPVWDARAEWHASRQDSSGGIRATVRPGSSRRIAIAILSTAAVVALMIAGWVWRAPPGGWAEKSEPDGTSALAREPWAWPGGPGHESYESSRGSHRAGEFAFGRQTLAIALGQFGEAILEGPGRAEWLSTHRFRLLEGSVRVRIHAPEGHGFVVETPVSTVTDWGTEFAVRVAGDRTSTVAVFEGMVDLTAKPIGQASQPIAYRLHAGDGLQVSPIGDLERLMAIVSGQNATFTHLADYSRQDPPPLILDVRDNVLGLGSHRFYEIVPGGLRQETRAYVDRPFHQWKGVTEPGLPEYLVGLDYIRTFNEDKQRRHLALDVQLSRPADVYVFFDARLPVPEWLRADFRDTGDRIGLETGPWRGSDGRVLGLEAGEMGGGQSKDHEFMVWVRRVEQAGFIRLGSAAGPTGLSSMYGVAVAEVGAE